MVTRRADHTAGGGAGTDAEWKPGAASDIANEEVRFVASDVPGLRRETARAVLFETMCGSVTGVDMQI